MAFPRPSISCGMPVNRFHPEQALILQRPFSNLAKATLGQRCLPVHHWGEDIVAEISSILPFPLVLALDSSARLPSGSLPGSFVT